MNAFRPLDGVRIVEFSTSIAGPASTMILAQLGADVVKVESPDGDDARGWPPHIGDRSVVYRQMCVGKRGIVIDLKQPEGVEVALAAVTADDAGLVGECADLIYHLIVLLRARELDWSDVRSELARRARA